jgi:hypothetical protein
MRTVPVLIVMAASALGAEPPRTELLASTLLPLEADGCLDHAVKELGMSAKRLEKERRWKIGPQFIHPSIVEGGTVGVELKKGEHGTSVEVRVSWPGAPKADVEQSEVEERVSLVAGKMAQMCGVTQPEVRCELVPAGGAARACAARTR